MKYAIIISFLLISQNLLGQLELTTDRTNAFYQLNETINFRVSSNQSGTIAYKILYDRFVPALETGSITISAGQTLSIPYQSNEPGIVYCQVSQSGNTAFSAAAVDPFNISAIGNPPTDLDQYWDDQKDLLAQVPLDLQISLFEEHENSYTYRVDLRNIDGRRVYGLLSVPNTEGPHPAIVTLPPFGNAPNVVVPEFILAERVGALSFTLSVHNVPVDQTDPIGYDQGDTDDPDSIYYRYAILGAMRAIDYLETRDDFSGVVAINGVSQGAGLSMLVAGIDDRISLMAQSNGALCQHSGILENKASGFPYYINQSRFEQNDSVHESQTITATKYFDAVHLNKNIDFPTYHIISYRDTITPSATVFAAYNQIIAPKVLLHAPLLGHQHPDEYISFRRNFYRRHFPGPLQPSWPFPSDLTGYLVDAGPDANADLNESISLSALVMLDSVFRDDFPAVWDVVSGPGVVNFENKFSYETEVNFSLPGEYLLRFTAFDGYPAEPNRFYSVQDYVRVVSEGTVSTENINETEIIGLKLTPNPTQGQIKLTLENPFNGSLNIYNSSGQLVRRVDRQSWTDGMAIELEDLAAGVYWLGFVMEGKRIIKKLVVI